MKAGAWLPVAGVALAGGLIAWLNRGERVVLHAGIATFYQAPLTLVLFLAFVAGMLAMMALSLRHDLRIREELRAHGLLDDPAPRPGAAPAPRRDDPVKPAIPHSLADERPHPPVPSPWAGMDAPRRAPDDDATLPHPRDPDPSAN